MEFGDSFFDQVGLGGMKPKDREAFAKYIRGLLEVRVGTRFTRQMTDQQIDHLNKLLDSLDNKALDEWLGQNLPNYKEVVAEELARLKLEIKTNAEAILASTQPPSGSSSSSGRQSAAKP